MATEQRLISLDEAIARIKDDGILGNGYSDDERIDDVIDMLECCHEVEARPVVHGRWLFVTKGQHTSVYVCSKCNRAVTVVCDEDIREEKLAKDYPYCHCGADMRGIQND